jgi:hypothetical protein
LSCVLLRADAAVAAIAAPPAIVATLASETDEAALSSAARRQRWPTIDGPPSSSPLSSSIPASIYSVQAAAAAALGAVVAYREIEGADWRVSTALRLNAVNNLTLVVEQRSISLRQTRR